MCKLKISGVLGIKITDNKVNCLVPKLLFIVGNGRDRSDKCDFSSAWEYRIMNTSNYKVYYYIFNTKFGYLGILASEKGLRSIVLPHKNKNVVYKKLINNLNNKQTVLKENKEKLNDYYVQILGYLNGISKSFRAKLDLQGYSDFSKAVWHIAKEIPYGETRTYSWIAMKMGKPQSARAVGNALGINPIPIIIPCHRVIKKDGSIGGFSAGLKLKKFLLDLEKRNLKKFNKIR